MLNKQGVKHATDQKSFFLVLFSHIEHHQNLIIDNILLRTVDALRNMRGEESLRERERQTERQRENSLQFTERMMPLLQMQQGLCSKLSNAAAAVDRVSVCQ